MNDIINQLLNFLGFGTTINDGTNPLILFCVGIIVLCIMSLFSFYQILVYFGIRYVIEHPAVVAKLPKH